MTLANDLLALLEHVQVLPRRISLDTPGVRATAPLLRGVWGAALHDLDRTAYEAVFMGTGSAHLRTPGYVLRPAAPDPADAPAIEWILIGPAIAYDQVLMRAWDVASGMGLGPDRRRFHVKAVRGIDPAGTLLSDAAGPWTLAESRWWPAAGTRDGPRQIEFLSPLRLLRRGRLIDQPTFPDLVVAALRRLQSYLPEAEQAALSRLRPAALEAARALPSGPWQGTRLDLVRWSASQQEELELRGVVGRLELPEGPGELWPLLAAARWLHLGKATIVGLGQLELRLA